MRQKVFLGLLILLIGLGIFSVVYAVMNPEKNVFNYISGSATVVIAILTMAYVYVTSRQLDVMGKQLEQMEIDRKLQNQPLPYVNNVDLTIEKPGFYFSPLEPEYEALARYSGKIKIRNIGNYPAVCVNVSARIEIPGRDKKRYFGSVSIYIPTIGEKENYPADSDDDNEFLFAGDGEGLLIQALREVSVDKMPLLSCRVLFRNIMGGCFVLNCRYRLYPKRKEDVSLFGEWLSAIQSFGIRYKTDIENLRDLRRSNEERCDAEFRRLAEVFSGSISGEDAGVEVWPIPGSFGVSSITAEEYQEEIKDVAYGVKLTGSMKCIAE